jgi:hypothetical protein
VAGLRPTVVAALLAVVSGLAALGVAVVAFALVIVVEALAFRESRQLVR